MAKLTAVTFATIALVLSTLVACAGDAVQDRNSRTTDESARSCTPPQTAAQPTPERTVEDQYLKVTRIHSKTVGVIANEPKYIVAAVPNIYASGTKSALSGTADREPYHVQDLTDGQNFEIAGIPFQIAIHPERDEVTICQLTRDSGESSAPPSP